MKRSKVYTKSEFKSWNQVKSISLVLLIYDSSCSSTYQIVGLQYKGPDIMDVYDPGAEILGGPETEPLGTNDQFN